jgi:hypothetical protein
MIKLVRRHVAAVALVCALGAAAAPLDKVEAATITDSVASGTLAAQVGIGTIREIDLGTTRCGNNGPLETNVGTFRRMSETPGSGQSVCGNPNQVQIKDGGASSPHGRFNPSIPNGPWIDSNDLERVAWEIDMDALGFGIPLRGIEFALIDAFDQRDWGGLGESFFELSVTGATRSWTIDSKDPDGKVYWITILFDDPVMSTVISFNTRLNDGYGIAGAMIAPIPAPPAALLAIGGFALLIAVRRRRRS